MLLARRWLTDFEQAGVILGRWQRSWESQRATFQRMLPAPATIGIASRHFDGSQLYVVKLGWENVLPHQKFSGSLFLRSYYRKSLLVDASRTERFQRIAR